MKGVKLIDWGIKEYQQAWREQEVLFDRILEEKKNHKPKATQDYLILVEHPHVYTLGKNGAENNLLIDKVQLCAQNVQFVKTNRGGDITYHGLGQLVGYPILNLENYAIGLREYIDRLEESIIATIGHYGLKGERAKGATGVWLDVGTPHERKICAIGVKSSRYVTMHGFALNVNTDLQYFNQINPCGFTNKGVTSMQKELAIQLDIEEVKKTFVEEFKRVFEK